MFEFTGVENAEGTETARLLAGVPARQFWGRNALRSMIPIDHSTSLSSSRGLIQRIFLIRHRPEELKSGSQSQSQSGRTVLCFCYQSCAVWRAIG